MAIILQVHHTILIVQSLLNNLSVRLTNKTLDNKNQTDADI